MTKFNYNGYEYDEEYIVAHVMYTVNVNRMYMASVLKEWFGSRWTKRAELKFGTADRLLGLFRYSREQELLDMVKDIMEALKKEVEWTSLDEEAIRHLGVKAFTELNEEDRNRLHKLWMDVEKRK